MRLRQDLVEYFVNHLVTNIPSWRLRKVLLRSLGMQIGKDSRILMGCRFQGIRNISVGDRSYINAKCHLDGRGGLEIGNDVNISNYCRCISAGHDMNSKYFAYRPGHVKIEDFCWLGTGAMVLDNSQLARGTVISAGSVFKGISETNDVYMGVPARFIKKRNLSGSYHVIWKPWFK